jgi:hypothetical protein
MHRRTRRPATAMARNDHCLRTVVLITVEFSMFADAQYGTWIWGGD